MVLLRSTLAIGLSRERLPRLTFDIFTRCHSETGWEDHTTANQSPLSVIKRHFTYTANQSPALE